MDLVIKISSVVQIWNERGNIFEKRKQNRLSVPYMERERKNLPKEVILYAFSVLIWCERRKKVKNFSV